SALSGGARGRLGLARHIISTADVLLLDEPTNHLDLETTRWLEQYLAASERTVLLVSHDRAFLSATVDHVLHLEGDTATAYAAGYTDFVAQRAERRLAQQRAFQQQQRTIAHEKDYIARNIAGQNSKQAKGRRKRLERLPRLSPVIGAEGTMALRFEVAERGGDQVVTAKNVSVAVGARTLVERFSGTLERTGVVAIIGRNGAGKSTLLRALLILMLSGANLLILDEPTNHLDVESIEALEDAVEGYDGAVILVSHDRALLRALTTRIWILHERHMTEFAGGFAEWEEVSTERAHAAAVSAAEEQALRQVHERHRVARSATNDPRTELRRAQRELEEAEATVAELEAQVAKLVAALEDPALYTRPDGAARAHELGARLETLKRELEAGLERWTQATEQV